ncbi:hypothetical protein GOP47_0027529 [Adiantum capillus-veneris]|nr:hypothetical protein GOP47_0027529 [Adiantum capillus-veneris]
MREPGGGTLFSQVIERPKLSVKVAAAVAAESNESKRRLSNGGSTYAPQSYGGAVPKSMLGGSILQASVQASAMQPRLKGGSVGTMVVQGQRHSTLEMHDLSAMERLKELRARLEPLLKTKPAHSPSLPPPPPPPPPEESSTAAASSLPQWGLFKRARRSRFEASKPIGAAAPAKALPLRYADEGVNPVRVHGWSHSTSAFIESDGYFGRGATAAARNGVNSRASANGCPSARHGNIFGERTGGLAGPSHNGEPSTSVRQRSEGSAEAPLVNNYSNGHMTGAAVHISRTSEAATGSASLNAKPRLELQTLDWPRLNIGLSRKEKEDDFLVFKGSKLPQRPKKRPKVVERTLHYCTPGNSLCDLARGRYDVREKKSVKKRPRGLKAMESMESDSE